MAVQKGHIRLGAPGALRDYLLTDPKQFVATPANPMAAKIATGGGSYDDFENWSYWVQEDWSAGAGRQPDKVSNGYLFGTCSAFMRGRLTLPFEYRVTGTLAESDAFPYMAVTPNCLGELAIGSTQTYKKAAALGFRGYGSRYAWFYIYVDGSCSSVTFERWTEVGGEPWPTLIDTVDVDISDLHPGGYWLPRADGGSDSYCYWSVAPTVNGETLYVPYWEYDAAVSDCTPRVYNGSSWVAPSVGATNAGFFIITGESYNALTNTSDASGNFAEVDMAIHRNGITTTYHRNDTSGNEKNAPFTAAALPGDEAWGLLSFGAGPSTSYLLYGGVLWGDTVYQAFGTKLYKINTSNVRSEVGTDLSAKVLATWNGYLYRAADNQLWYTADGSTWTGPLDVGPSGTVVTGMAGMGDYLYIATEDGLYYLAPGDFIVGIAPWPVAGSDNGSRMVNHSGSLYFPLKNRIWQFTPSGAFTDVWLAQDADIPSAYLGTIKSLSSTHLGLVASVDSLDDTVQGSVWLMQSEGWHCLAILPKGVGSGKMLSDPTNERLWVFGTNGTAYAIPFRPLATIPARDPEQRWESYGWVESDWYYGNLVDVPKDWESVTIFGDNLSANQKVRVFYKDSEAADWTLLGTATADNTELRWEQDTYRPTSNRMKIGLLLSTNDKTSTPEVRAVRVKYLPMIADRWRWQLPLSVHADQQMLDGSLNTYTVAQQLAHLDGLVTQVKPVIYEDIAGTQYEVKVLGASKQIIEFEARPDESRITKWVYALSLEQVTDGTYS